MTRPPYHADPYCRSAPGRVVAVTGEGGLVLDAPLFYPQGGGQPGDSGRLVWDGGSVAVGTTLKGGDGAVVAVPAEPSALPAPGTAVEQHLDWDRRHRHMRMHTALHLLSVIIPLPVTGGAVGAERGRLDFDMPDAPEDREVLQGRLNALVDRDLPVVEDWITTAQLDARPELVKTMSVAPPRSDGPIRLIGIGTGAGRVDLQPCGGTHVRSTAEIGKLALGKIEKKGRQNRRVSLLFA